jgi:hypothetical protein
MSKLPSSEALANLVNEAVENMWGVPLTYLAETTGQSHSVHSRMVRLDVSGAPGIAVVVSSDEAGGEALGGVMFSCSREELSPSMVEDSLCELANILAGQIKTLIAPDHLMSLPSVVAPDAVAAATELTCATLSIGGSAATVTVAVTTQPLAAFRAA